MKNKLTSFCAAALIASSAWLQAGEPPVASKGSPEFERLKNLVGSWKGQTDMGQGPMEMTLNYRLLAGGSVVEERVFEGTPMEMVTMFYEKNGKLALTHYCVAGNQPTMLLKSSDAKTLSFDLDPACGLDKTKGMYMGALTLRFEDEQTMTASCKAFVDGQAQPVKECTLKRIRTGSAVATK